jgi:hypothetical protein
MDYDALNFAHQLIDAVDQETADTKWSELSKR